VPGLPRSLPPNGGDGRPPAPVAIPPAIPAAFRREAGMPDPSYARAIDQHIEDILRTPEDAPVRNYFENNVVKFVQVLRHLGIRVSSAETVDAINALTLVEVVLRPQVRAALRAMLVKDPDEQFIFDRAFDLFFVPGEEKAARIEVRQFQQAQAAAQLEYAERELRFQDSPLSLTDDQKAAYSKMAEEQKQKLKSFLEQSSAGHKVDHTFQPLIENIVRGHLERWKKQYEEAHGPLLRQERLTGDQELDQIIDEILTGSGEEKDPILSEDMKNIPDRDVPKVTLIIKKLTRRLATRISRRFRMTRKRRQVDLRRTIRSNIRYGGAMLDLKFRKRRIDKPDLLLFCDVSGSMAKYASFVLQFTYGLSSVVRGIESFIFAEDLERVTTFFTQKRPFEETMAAIMNQSVVWGKGTDLARALRTFLVRHRQVLTADTIIIIVSDTKTVSAAQAADTLAVMRRRVRDVLWLNTLPRAEWDDVGSVEFFRGLCQMFECYTLVHLEKILRHQMA
jgi:uncharacterized protein with von Willebrand factor type A (vWA) domain